MIKKVFFGLMLGCGVALWVSRLWYRYDRDMVMLTTPQSFFASIYPALGFPEYYAKQEFCSQCNIDSGICHQIGAYYHPSAMEAKDTDRGIYFGGSLYNHSSTKIPNRLDFLGTLHASGTFIVKGDKSFVNNYILENWSGIVMYAKFDEKIHILEQRKSKQPHSYISLLSN